MPTSTVDIFHSIRPTRGKYIAEGKYGFGIVDGTPAMRCRWHGGFLRSEEVFQFRTQTEGFLFLDTKSLEAALHVSCVFVAVSSAVKHTDGKDVLGKSLHKN